MHRDEDVPVYYPFLDVTLQFDSVSCIVDVIVHLSLPRKLHSRGQGPVFKIYHTNWARQHNT